jgi:hypothetical protein
VLCVGMTADSGARNMDQESRVRMAGDQNMANKLLLIASLARNGLVRIYSYNLG